MPCKYSQIFIQQSESIHWAGPKIILGLPSLQEKLDSNADSKFEMAVRISQPVYHPISLIVQSLSRLDQGADDSVFESVQG
jgi:hypothetical protein